MDDATLRQLALDIVEGRVVGTWTMYDNPDMVPQVFPLLNLMDAEGYAKVQGSAHIYEYLSKAGPWAVNGKPMFMSFHILTLEDWEPLRLMLRELTEQRQVFLKTPDA